MSKKCIASIVKKFAKPGCNNSATSLTELTGFLKENYPAFLTDKKACPDAVKNSPNAISFLFTAYEHSDRKLYYEPELILALRLFTGALAVLLLFCFFLALLEPRDEDEYGWWDSARPDLAKLKESIFQE